MNNRQYDVVLYGASGFVGKQTAQYFAQHVNPREVKWAIAGRNPLKLAAVKSQLGDVGSAVDLLVAESGDPGAIDEIVSQTRVLLNTAGPFALYGTGIVDACVRWKTHYLDITGEPPWVKQLIQRYHDRAAANGTKIIPFSGFDSVPSDLGTYLVVRHLQRQWGTSCRSVKAYFQAAGGLNGGTLASALDLIDSGKWQQMRDPFLLNPPQHYSPAQAQQSRDPQWIRYERELGAWVSPFFMGAINTRVVRRSCALYDQWQEPYGQDFTYQEYLKLDPPLGGFKAAGMVAGMTLGLGLLASPLRSLVQSRLPQPGSGPSVAQMEAGWFRCKLLGLTQDGRKVQGVVADRGDPGNRATTKLICESALSLVLGTNTLPGGSRRGGILTPATGLGDVLVERLRRAGMRLEVIDTVAHPSTD